MMELISLSQRLADELSVRKYQVDATIELLDQGSTVPFIARYRKEVTGGLDDTQLRTLDERLRYLREMDERREGILRSITSQEKLTPELESAIYQATDKTTLEDLYLPYKPKRRTKAQIAKEAGLEPLADLLLNNPGYVPEVTASDFLSEEHGIADVKAALDGARAILMERFSEEAALIGLLREKLWKEAELIVKVIPGQENNGQKFADYFDYRERIQCIPSHRALAVLRGRNVGVLSLSLAYQSDDVPVSERSVYEIMIAEQFVICDQGRVADRWLLDAVRLSWRAKIFLSLELELLSRLKDNADEEAISVFGKNLRDLLLTAPAGLRPTLGLDPGLRTGVKVAVVNETGKLMETTTIYPHPPRNDWNGALQALTSLIKKYYVELIAIGNGTASRETDKLAQQLIKQLPEFSLQKVVVSEAGASVYSASELAAKEFPVLDVSLRGAVSIARRLQDPLAELVKIEPKSIGVGQYQHDVNQSRLVESLEHVVEDCVNAVGVDVNSASVPLLSKVAGLNTSIAAHIVAYRDEHGMFKNRKILMKVPRLGAKTFEQAAGFLRIRGGDNPLDASAVHPEAYPLVEKIAKASGKALSTLIGNSHFLSQLNPADYIDDQFGLPTVTDILKELDKPGRDPRPQFKTAEFQEGVETINDLTVGMVLEGVVTNVANFGVFVDIGVHQDGLVHISAMADRYVEDPHKVVKAGDVIRVKVMDVEADRKRIALSMRLNDNSDDHEQAQKKGNRNQSLRKTKIRQEENHQSAMADALSRLKLK